jgi:hypothetical protein
MVADDGIVCDVELCGRDVLQAHATAVAASCVVFKPNAQQPH